MKPIANKPEKPTVKLFGQQVELFGNNSQPSIMEGQTKQGKGGNLTFRNHRWHLDDEYKNKKPLDKQPAEFSRDPRQQSIWDDERGLSAKNTGQRQDAPLSGLKEKIEKLDQQSKTNRTNAINYQIQYMISQAKSMLPQFKTDLQNALYSQGNLENYTLAVNENIDTIYAGIDKGDLPPNMIMGTVSLNDISKQGQGLVDTMKSKGYQVVKKNNTELGQVVTFEKSSFPRIELVLTNDRLSEAQDKLGHTVKSLEDNLSLAFPDAFQTEDESKIINPINTSASDQEKVEHLVKLSKENEPIVNKFLEKIDKKFNTRSKFSYKEPDRIISKSKRPEILAKKSWFKIEHIRDSFRFKTVLDSVESLEGILDELKNSGMEIIKTDVDKLLQPKEWGWRFVAFDLRMPNGQLVEYYLPVKELEQAKKNGNHHLFEKWRNTTDEERKQNAKEYRKDIWKSRQQYQRAWNSYLKRQNQTQTEFEDSWNSLKSRLRASSSLSSRMVKSVNSSGLGSASANQTPSFFNRLSRFSSSSPKHKKTSPVSSLSEPIKIFGSGVSLIKSFIKAPQNVGNNNINIYEKCQDIIYIAKEILSIYTEQFYKEYDSQSFGDTLATPSDISASKNPSILLSVKKDPKDLILELKSSLKAIWQPIRAKLLASSTERRSSDANFSKTSSML